MKSVCMQWFLVLILAVSLAVRSAAQSPTPVYAPQGQVINGFPPSLILDPSPTITTSYLIDYGTAGILSVSWNSSMSVFTLYDSYVQYLSVNGWTNITPSPGSPTASAAAVFAYKGLSSVNVGMTSHGAATNVVVAYTVGVSPGNWAHSWGGGGADTGNAVARDSNGNIYVVGSTNSSGAGGYDVLLLKYAADGTLLWRRTWGGTGDEFGSGIVVDANGNSYIAGSTSSFGAGWFDALILKFDTNGKFQWARTWGGGSFDRAYDIVFDSGGNLALAGEAYSLGNAAVLLRFATDGTFLQNSSYAWKGTATYDSAYTIGTDSQGNIILAGISWDYSVSPLHNSILILKYDSTGRPVFAENWKSPGEDEAWGFHGIATDVNQNIYVGGRHAGICNTSDFSQCNFDNLLLKLDSSGNFQWAKTWGGLGYDNVTSLGRDSSGNVVAAGMLNEFPGALLAEINPSSGGIPPPQIFATGFDSLGNPTRSVVHSGGSDAPTQVGLVLDPSNNVIVTGAALNNSGTWVQATPVVSTPSGCPSNDCIVASSIAPFPVGIAAGSLLTQPAEAIPTGTADTGGGAADTFVSAIPSGSVIPPPPPTTHTLTVNSTNPGSGVQVSVSPADKSGASGGKTPLTLTYDEGVSVIVSAPPMATAGGNSFSSWTGCDTPPSNPDCMVTMNGDLPVTANYVTPTPPPPPPSTGDFQWPVLSPILPSSNDYGTYNAVGNHMFHTGIDLVTALGTDTTYNTPVYAAADGDVSTVFVTTDSSGTELSSCPNRAPDGASTISHGFGNVVVIHHPNGMYSLYGHLDCVEPTVAPGVHISRGQQIGVMGNSTTVQRDDPARTRVHLHFEIKDQSGVGQAASGGACGPTSGTASDRC